MTNTWKDLRINKQRFKKDFDELAEIGSTGNGGVHRPALGEAHLAARAWFRGKAREAGLYFFTDGAGNHSARLACGPDAHSPCLMLGSHLDSVPNGGRFDGALGVVAALEALRTVKEAGLSLPVHLEAIDFTDEEGTLFGLFGSSAMAGHIEPDDLKAPRGGRQAFQEALRRGGLSEEGILSAKRDPATMAGYLELHVEQGPRLLAQEMQIGIVTAIVGICSYRLAYVGLADHAGTTSMDDRLDAAQGASAFTLAARELVMESYPDCVVNIGDIQVQPGAYNIIPARVELALEFRSPDGEQFQALEKDLIDLARDSAEKFGLGLEVKFQGRHQPAPMNEQAQTAFEAACDTLGLGHIPLTSFAGHDGQSLAELCPTGMIFVPSVGGASHAPREFTGWQDCINGANALLQAALEMAGKFS